MASCFLTRMTLALLSVVLLFRPATLAQNRVSDAAKAVTCERELKKLGAQRLGARFTSPMAIRRVGPEYPPIPDDTTGGGVWIGEVLLDALGHVSNVWTVREVKLSPPVSSLNKAIADAVLKWEFAPAAVDKVAVPVCWTVTVNVNLETIKSGR
jgi:hypothetical protein